jgi:transposase
MLLEKKAKEKAEEKPEVSCFEFEVKIEEKTCPECGTKIKMAEGCFICLNCGYSGCS